MADSFVPKNPGDVLATPEPNTTLKPRFKVVVNDEDWSDMLLHGQMELWSVHRNGSFTLDFDFDDLGARDERGVVAKDSRLGKILEPHLDPFRDIVQIFLGYGEGKEPEVVLDGVVDSIEGSQDTGVVTFRGRDKSAILQESFTHAQFRNKTVAGAVQELAEKHGLESDIVDPGMSLGTIFDEERISFEHIPSAGYNDWDLLNRFAVANTYAVYVTGNTLHFRPIEDGETTIVFRYGYNIESIQWRKNFSVAQSRVGIELLSTNIKKKDSAYVVVGTAKGTPGKGDSALYRYTDAPSQDPQVLGVYAEALAMMHAQFEQLVTITGIGSLDQKLSNKLAVEETGTIFDAEYRIMSVKWNFGYEYGWTAEVTGLLLPAGPALSAHRKAQKRSLSKVSG